MSKALPNSIALSGAKIHLKTTDASTGPVIGTAYSYSDGKFELNLGAYPAQGSTLVFDINTSTIASETTRPLAAIINGPLDDVRLEIGQVTIAGKTAQVHFFGIPPFDARIVF